MLEVIIREKIPRLSNPHFFSLFADGPHSDILFDKSTGISRLSYPANSVIFLYYTYPAFREACAIRAPNNNADSTGLVSLPSVSGKVSLLFSVSASKVDKLRRAVSFLNTHSNYNAYSFHNAFYTRLYFIITQKGKINYEALHNLIRTY